jgi:NADH-quinone oxidoreductase subunit E
MSPLNMQETFNKILEHYITNDGNIITILQDIEKAFGYIPEDAVNWFSQKLDIPASRFFGTATFYSQFHLKPRGKNVITVCRGTACHVKNSSNILYAIESTLNIKAGETSRDKKFSIEVVNCIGACSIAPVITINDEYFGRLTVKEIPSILKKFTNSAKPKMVESTTEKSPS